MLYTSTRDKSVRVTAAEAIAKGISSEGGLFVPTEIPAISKEFIEKLDLYGIGEQLDINKANN